MATYLPNPELERELKRLADLHFWYGPHSLDEAEKQTLLEWLIASGKRVGPLWVARETK